MPPHRRPLHLELLADGLDLNYRGVDADYLPLIHVIDECERWLTSPTDWTAGWARHPRRSLARETLLGLANLGPSVRSAASGAVEAAESAVDIWRSAFPPDAGPVGGVVLASLVDLRTFLLTATGLGSVWDDLVCCHAEGLRNWRRRERVLDFFALSEAVGHGAPWFALDLVGLIRDAKHTVETVRSQKNSTRYDGSEIGVAGTTLSELAELLDFSVRRAPPFGDCVVWLEYEPADLGGADHVAAGRVDYWRARHLIDLVKGPATELPSPLDELRLGDERIVLLPKSEDVGVHTVWARVALGERVPTGALEDANAMAMLLADLAAVRVGGPRWVRGDWAQVLIDGRTHSAGGHRPPSFPPFPDHMRAVGDQLAWLAKEASWSAPRAALGRVSQLWAEVEAHEGPADRVPAVVRVIESLMPQGVRNASLKSTVPMATAWKEQSTGFSNPVLGALQDLAVDEGRYRAAPEAFVDALPNWPRVMNYELVPLLESLEHALSTRSERFAIDVRNSRRLADDPTEQGSDYEGLRGRHLIAWERVLRYRNAVTHGSPAPLTTGVVAQTTADRVGLAVVDAALRAAHSDRPVTVELQRDAWWARVPGWERTPRSPSSSKRTTS